MVTVEAAIALSAIFVVLVAAVFGIVGVSMHIRCIDAAREATRIAAQGDSVRATQVARKVAPSRATITIDSDGDLIRVRVAAEVPVLTLDVGADAVAAREPVADE